MARSHETWGGADYDRSIAAARRSAEVMTACGYADAGKQLADAADAAASTRFAIGIVGRTNRGKSTLINGILGRKDDLLAPVEKAPATNVVTCFANGETEQAWVVFSQEGEPRRAEAITFSQIKSFACEEHNPDNAKGVSRIEVMSPFPRLPANVVLVDTPGSHNALSRAHGELLIDYLPRLDAVVFMISADAPLIAAELELLANVRKCDISKILFAMNKADKVESDELAEGVAHNRQVLASVGLGNADLFTISAKQYWQTGAEPGVERLLLAIAQLLQEERGRIVAKKLQDMTARLCEAFRAECVEELSTAEKSDAELQGEIATLKNIEKQLTVERPSRERRFRRQWSESVGAFEDSIPAVRNQVLAECRDLVDSTNPLQFSVLAQTLHTTVIKKLDDALQPHMQRMRQDLEEASRSLEVDFAMQLKSIEGFADRVNVPTSGTERTLATIGAGVMPAIGAAICSQVPGMIASAIISTAPTVATVVWWNPLSWVMFAGTGVAAGGVGLAAGAAGALLTPVAAIGTPVLLGYAGYKMATSWIARNAQTRDELSMATRDRIEQLIGELRTNVSRLKRKDEEILTQFDNMLQSQINAQRSRLEECSSRRPSPARIEQLRDAVARLAAESGTNGSSSRTLPSPLF